LAGVCAEAALAMQQRMAAERSRLERDIDDSQWQE